MVDSSEMTMEDNLDSTQWTELFKNGKYHVAFDEDNPIELDDEWLSETEQMENIRRLRTEFIQICQMCPSLSLPLKHLCLFPL